MIQAFKNTSYAGESDEARYKTKMNNFRNCKRDVNQQCREQTNLSGFVSKTFCKLTLGYNT